MKNILFFFILILCFITACNKPQNGIQSSVSSMSDAERVHEEDLDLPQLDSVEYIDTEIGKYTKVKKGDSAAISFLNHFYANYPSKGGAYLLPEIMENYTYKLKLKLTDFNRDYDPMVNGQDYYTDWAQYLRIVQDAKDTGVFYIDFGFVDASVHSIQLTLVKFEDSYLIDDIELYSFAQPGDIEYLDWGIWAKMGVDLRANAEVDAARYAKVEMGDNEAISFLTSFYTNYLSEDLGGYLSPDIIKNYTLRLMQRLAVFTPGYDPIVNGQDWGSSWKETMRIVQDAEQANVFHVNLGSMNYIKLSLVKFENSYLIDDLFLD